MSETLLVTRNPNPALDTTCDALLLPVIQDGDPSEHWTAVDAALDGLLTDMRERREFTGEAYQIVVVPTLGRLPARRVAMVGLGKAADLTPNTLRQAAAAAARALGKRGLRSAAVDAAGLPFPADPAASVLVEGFELARYVPDPYRTGERRDIHVHELRVGGASETALNEGAVRGQAKNLARDLVNEPGNCLDPPELARRAAAMAAETGLECEVLETADLERLKMGAYLTVARGSETPPKFIVLRHRGGSGRGATLALIGKAVTFDTGGISLKPPADMGKMKGDMAGGAAVIGAMQGIARLGVACDVIGLVPAVDNMPSGRAWKPGDVVTAMSGKTIETMTTDAEGRMLLADALCYAKTLGATHMVDIATLTGACVIALGHVASGLYGTDEELVRAVRECGDAAGERHWPMPLFPEYREQIKSEIADLKNSGGRPGGSVTAAMFLKEFAGDTPWVHLDVAGSSTLEKGKPWAPPGPTGTGVGTFINLAIRMGSRE